MEIFVLHHPEDLYAAEIVTAAMIRSFTTSQVRQILFQQINNLPEGAVLINPKESERVLLNKLASEKRKILILGRIEKSIAQDLGLVCHQLPEDAINWGKIEVNLDMPFNLTSVAVFYNQNHFLGRSSVLNPRHLCRYDFTDEWNNLGYGRITVNGDIWSICNRADINGATLLAEMKDTDDGFVSVYATVSDMPSASVLWYNRQVGPVDSLEWNIIENFFGDYRPDELKCFPYLSEIPYGYRCAVTMRLDCDQAVSSARPLFELYTNAGLPFSLAVLTGLNMSSDDKQLLKDVVNNGGALLSHSHNHFPNWGGDYKTVFAEAVQSRQWLEKNIPESAPVKYAVSPFHQNPEFAVRALADAGYKGFVGGIIHNDPEFLFGKAGRSPLIKTSMLSHSQQCMLHGDCFHRYGNSIEVYKESLLNHLKAEAIFGYLDHPFSEAYQYGWLSEDERLKVHKDFIEFISLHQGIWWCNENDCLDFLKKRDSAQIRIDNGELFIEYDKNDNLPPLAVIWKGQRIEG
jgi:hypothetical protein